MNDRQATNSSQMNQEKFITEQPRGGAWLLWFVIAWLILIVGIVASQFILA